MSDLRDAKSRARMIVMNTTHGLSKDPAYANWKDMKRRCFNPKNKRFADYAARGISVHADFVDSFPEFLAEIGKKPVGSGWSVGRIDNGGWYTYGNIRWERPDQQARNHSRQRNNTSGVTGVKVRSRVIAGNTYTTCTAVWNKVDGTRGTKDFSADKWGFDTAFAMAKEFRKETLKNLALEGVEYGATHGDCK